ncbi:MAG: hypothetical protein JOZ90_08075 [Alphaproteobacteria bacterium]|nr:hypothetical protein [Alphaproteobacteria bacterium]MBV9371615.1 hypothetical protein [Alphaproteobacteria bacterium]MBV9901042.1 hypothetical protein [Alphaproteobacteria bacterium]
MRNWLLPILAFPAAATAQPAPDARPPAVFLSPMGEPFRASAAGADLVGAWFRAADADGDGALTLGEVKADAARFFAALDTDGDGEIGPAELSRYENEVAREVQLGLQMRGWDDGRRRHRRREPPPGGGYDEGLEGAGRYSFLNIPEPVIAADQDLNRGVSREEFARAAGERFLLLDRDGDGRLTRAELPPLPQPRADKPKRRG